MSEDWEMKRDKYVYMLALVPHLKTITNRMVGKIIEFFHKKGNGKKICGKIFQKKQTNKQNNTKQLKNLAFWDDIAEITTQAYFIPKVLFYATYYLHTFCIY